MDTKATAVLLDGSKVGGRLTTDHAASSYGQPVFVDADNKAIDWINIASISTAPQMGASKSAAKVAAAKANGKKGGRPKKAS